MGKLVKNVLVTKIILDQIFRINKKKKFYKQWCKCKSVSADNECKCKTKDREWGFTERIKCIRNMCEILVSHAKA